MDPLQTDGYVIFRQVMDPLRLEKCTSPEDKADYERMQEFIDSHILPTINDRLGWQSDYVKFRYSNNNNSSDASNLHRDIILQKDISCPCYTCITYLDTATIEVVPGSHRRPFGTLWSALYDFATNRKVETLHPGDLMIFSSSLLHRGFFSYHISQRRILQVFQIFPSLTALQKSMKKSIHVICGGDGNNMMVYISKTPFNNHSNFIHYLNASTGYGIMKDLPFECEYLASEGMRPRLTVEKGSWQETNYYIIKHETINLPANKKKKFLQTCFSTQIKLCIFYFLFLLMLNVFFLWIIIRTIHSFFKNKRNKRNKIQK